MLYASVIVAPSAWKLPGSQENWRNAIVRYVADMALSGHITRENPYAFFASHTLSQHMYGVTDPLSFIIAKSAGVLRIMKA